MSIIEIKERGLARRHRWQDIQQAIEQMKATESATVHFDNVHDLRQARNYTYYFFNTRSESRVRVSSVRDGLTLIFSKERK